MVNIFVLAKPSVLFVLLCTIVFLYALIQMNCSLITPTTPMSHNDPETSNKFINIITLLKRMRGIAAAQDLNDIDNSIEFISTYLNEPRQRKEEFEYLKPQGQWDITVSNWKETFYPRANYSKDICSEIFVTPGDKIPRFTYFKMNDSCSEDNARLMSEKISILLNFATYPEEHLKQSEKIFNGINKLYNKMSILAAFPKGYSLPSSVNYLKSIFVTDDKPGTQWNRLIQQVKTPYILIARDIVDFDEDVHIERLIQEISPLKMKILGGAIKTSSDGHWSHGCLQTAHRNYSLVYKSGYRHSAHDCLYCHSILGPFLARTDFLKNNQFDVTLSESVLFYDYFFNLYKRRLIAGVCPDSMFNVRDKITTPLDKEKWLPLVRKRSLNRVTSPENKLFSYTCAESKVKGQIRKGFGTAPCKLQKLSQHIKLTMRICRQHNIPCELNCGTTLGAVKFNGVLPWERDADIYFLASNFSAVAELEPVFRKEGYSLKRYWKPGKGSYGAYHSYGSGWKVELYGKPWMHTAQLKSQGKKPTLILFDGEWVEVPNNVGQEIRDRYGPEVYKHVQHSSTLTSSKFSGKAGYLSAGHFTKCPTPGAHDCLDQHEADGNLQFTDPVP